MAAGDISVNLESVEYHLVADDDQDDADCRERGPEMSRRPTRSKHDGRRNVVFELCTTVAHVFLLGFTIYMLYLCFCDGATLFSWHPAMLTIGWVFLMTEAVLSLSAHNVFTRNLSYNGRIRIHWVLQAAAVTSIFIGFLVVVINKNRLGKSHFTSTHSIFGAASLACVLLSSTGGVAALFSVDLMKYVKPVYVKIAHAAGGIVSVILGSITIVLGIYSHWGDRNMPQVAQVTCSFVVVATVFVASIRPARTAYTRFRSAVR